MSDFRPKMAKITLPCDENQSIKDSFQMPIGPITRASAKKASRGFQWACEEVYLG